MQIKACGIFFWLSCIRTRLERTQSCRTRINCTTSLYVRQKNCEAKLNHEIQLYLLHALVPHCPVRSSSRLYKNLRETPSCACSLLQSCPLFCASTVKSNRSIVQLLVWRMFFAKAQMRQPGGVHRRRLCKYLRRRLTNVHGADRVQLEDGTGCWIYCN